MVEEGHICNWNMHDLSFVCVAASCSARDKHSCDWCTYDTVSANTCIGASVVVGEGY